MLLSVGVGSLSLTNRDQIPECFEDTIFHRARRRISISITIITIITNVIIIVILIVRIICSSGSGGAAGQVPEPTVTQIAQAGDHLGDLGEEGLGVLRQMSDFGFEGGDGVGLERGEQAG